MGFVHCREAFDCRLQLLQAIMHWSGKLLPCVFLGWVRVAESQRDHRAANASALDSYKGHLQRRALRCWRRGITARLAQRRLLRHAVARLQCSKLFVRFHGWCASALMPTKVVPNGKVLHELSMHCTLLSKQLCWSLSSMPARAEGVRYLDPDPPCCGRHAALAAARQASTAADAAYQHQYLRRPLAGWQTCARDMHRQADTLNRCLGRLRHRTAAMTFDRWRSVAAEQHRQRIVLQGSLHRLVHRCSQESSCLRLAVFCPLARLAGLAWTRLLHGVYMPLMAAGCMADTACMASRYLGNGTSTND